jgi:hypothetical protein
MPNTNGVCNYCQSERVQTSMARHLGGCPQRRAAGQSSATPLFHLVVEGIGPFWIGRRMSYWMHLELPAATTLDTLDALLRAQWLECCGHPSAFQINGVTYASPGDQPCGLGERAMQGVTLGQVLNRGDQFQYEYDFATPTKLKLKVADERGGVPARNKIAIMAQNLPPYYECCCCIEAATRACPDCVGKRENWGWLCEEHAREAEHTLEHPGGSGRLLPVVNSPRVGRCRYTG